MLTYSVDRERLAQLIAAAAAALDGDRTTAGAYIQQAAELGAYEEGRFLQRGGRLPLQVGAANLEGNAEEGASLSIGFANRRQAEMDPRERQRRYRMTLARANRIAAVGQMFPSIVHEINQPVAAVLNNDQAALRFLKGPKPNLEEVRQALARIAQYGATFRFTLPVHSDRASPEWDRTDA